MAYDFLTTMNWLNDRNFLENDLIETVSHFLSEYRVHHLSISLDLLYIICYSDIHDGSGASADLASLTFWPNNELASGNFSQCSAGLIDVSKIRLTFSY